MSKHGERIRKAWDKAFWVADGDPEVPDVKRLLGALGDIDADNAQLRERIAALEELVHFVIEMATPADGEVDLDRSACLSIIKRECEDELSGKRAKRLAALAGGEGGDG